PHHVVYVGADCDPNNSSATTCTIYSLDPGTGTTSVFASFSHNDVPFVDGIYFDPTGNFLFITNRIELFITDDDLGDVEVNNLTVADGTGAILQHLPMLSEPDGVSFHAAEKFVVTNDEAGGTMTKFVFPGNDYSQPPAPSGQLHYYDDFGDPAVLDVYGVP